MRPFLLGALLLAPPPSTPQEGPVHPALAGLSERWQGALAEFGAPGLAMVLVEGGKIAHLAVLGERDPERHLPVTPDTLFYLASATKPFVAFAIVQLAAEGKLELDAPVKRYLPRFELADAAATASITVRDLLCHRPGLECFPIVLLDAYTGEITEERYYRFLADVKPLGHVAYSNVHFTLLGRVIEAVTGKPWRDELAERLFAPAGMTRTSGYASRMYGDADVAIPTAWVDGHFVPAPVRKTDATMHAAGGLGSSARDLGRWILVNLGRGKLGSETLCPASAFDEFFRLQERTTTEEGLGKPEGFALSWVRGSYRDHVVLEHGGGYVGSSSHVYFFPELDLGLAVLVNADASGQALCKLVATDVFERLLSDDEVRDILPDLRRSYAARGAQPAAQPAATPVAAGAGSAGRLSLGPAAYAGVYRNDLWGTFTVEAGERGPRARLGELALALEPRGPDGFHAASPGALDVDGRFEIAGGSVTAIVLALREFGDVRFAR